MAPFSARSARTIGLKPVGIERAHYAALKRRSSTVTPGGHGGGWRRLWRPRSHQVQARGGRAAVATGLGEFAAAAGGRVFADGDVPGGEMVIESLAADRWFGELYWVELCWFEVHLFDGEGLKSLAFQLGIAGGFSRKRVFRERGFGDARFVRQRHANVDVLEDAARRDAEHAVGGFDEVIAFAAAVLAAEVIDEAETGAELFGFDEEACAVCGPLL